MKIGPENIQEYIDTFCSTVGWDGQPISFNLSGSISEMIGYSISPEPVLVLTDRLWVLMQDVIDEKLKQTLCLILASLKFKKDVELGAPEWRYWAFKCGLLQHKSEIEFNTLQVLVEEW